MFFADIRSPVGPLRLASDGTALTGLWLAGQKYFAAGLEPKAERAPELPVFQETAAWLKGYFCSGPLPPLPPLSPRGTAFRQTVWRRLLEIPYGRTVSYGTLAAELGSSPRAVGNAAGHNPISILIPCHRVTGKNGALTGYAAGITVKRYLLTLEGVNLSDPGSAETAQKGRFLPTAALGPQEPPVPGGFSCPCC